MSKRGLGLGLVLMFAVAGAGAALFETVRFDLLIAEERAAAETVHHALQSVQVSIASLRGAQAAYFAVGQGPDFWPTRASELAGGRMNDFRYDGELWWWHVIGKGSKAEKIPVVDDMIKALIRYRAYLGFTPLPLDNDDSPLLRSTKNGSPITARQLNLILDKLFEAAAKLLEMKSAELPASAILGKAEYQTRAAKIRQASSHWGRHTSITFQVRSGIPKEIVQLNARHNDSRTTEGYTHEDEKHWHSEAQKLRSD